MTLGCTSSLACVVDGSAQPAAHYFAVQLRSCVAFSCTRVAVGDLHGDMGKAKRSLQIARVAEEKEGRMIWTGGDTVVVQLGDVLDRGDTEIGEFCY